MQTSFETTVNFVSPMLQEPQKVRDAGGVAVMKTARSFRDRTKQNMIDGPQTGKLYGRKRGEGFRRFHRASARGERPAVDTGLLLNSIEAERTGDTSAQVVAGTPYAGYLNDPGVLDRPIMNEEDAQAGQQMLHDNYREEIAKLV